MAMNGLIIALFEMVTIFKLEGKRPHLQFISLGVVLTGISYLILNVSFISYAQLAVVSMVVITVGEMLAIPFMNSYWIPRTQAQNRGQYAALFTVAWSLAQAAGPLIGSVIAERLGFQNLWLITGLVCMLLALLYWRLQLRNT